MHLVEARTTLSGLFLFGMKVMTNCRYTPCFISGVLAAVRVMGCRSECFQAAAHLWVGGLIGAWILGGLSIEADIDRTGRSAGWLALVLSLVELWCFFRP
jgi:hypothetical protein